MTMLADAVATSPSFTRHRAGSPATAEPTELAAYHPSWPARFRVEAEVLRVALAALSPRFEHIGSTAVPGMSAKPIIDVLLGVPDPTAVDGYAPRLDNFGYQLAFAADAGGALAHATRLLVRTVRGVRTHHVYVVEYLGEQWHRLLLFRDVLRIDTPLAGEYEALKRRLAGDHAGNPLAYARAKGVFVQRALGIELV
jgi:GrpB-like predicted nucleotidyltransferase (UPF0157 family)